MARAIGIDVGTRTLGVAISDEGGTVAFPVTVVRRSGMRRDIAALLELARERGADTFVIGMPYELDGRDGPLAAEARAVGERLAAEGFEVVYHDERMSTVAAERALLEADMSRRKRRRVVDKVAAALVLQAWLDARARGGTS
ncbi:MAG: Holliday junction resolvase RuvX [Acidobacteriota bacterium]|nr:MAG: Holliday junction resolvase RuvX [Acidobacteriota bacterium]